MTGQQIKWASQHDWFVSTNGAEITVYESETNRTYVWTGTFRQLREWAGY